MHSKNTYPAHHNDKENHSSTGTMPYEATPANNWNGSFTEYSTATPHAHTVNEHAQAYALTPHTPHDDVVSQEHPPHEYASMIAGRGEKITSYRIRNKSRKGWWAALAVTAMLFLGLGRLSTTSFMPEFGFGGFTKDPGNAQVTVASSDRTDFSTLFKNPLYQQVMLNNLSTVLPMTQQQILDDLNHQGNIQTVATNHDVSADRLHKSELNAFVLILKDATKTGMITQQDADLKLKQLQSDPELSNSIATSILITATSEPFSTPPAIGK